MSTRPGMLDDLKSKSGELPSDSLRVQAKIDSHFRSSPYHEIRRIHARFTDGSVVLTGEVTSFHLKQIAQTILQQVDEVKRITNLLSVCSRRPRPR